MAILRVQNNTPNLLNVPVVNLLIKPYHIRDAEIIDIDQFYNDERVQDLMEHPAKITVTLVSDSTPGSEGDAVLPFHSNADMPDAIANPGMMVYNTTNDIVMFSEGTQWLAVSSLLIVSGSLPAPSSVPAGYILFSKDEQAIYVNGGSAWMLTQANGVRGLPGHLFPTPNTVPYGTMIIDTDTKQLRVSDQNRWLYPCYSPSYSSYSSLPLPTNVPIGALAFTLDTQSLFIRQGANWVSAAAQLKYYPTYADLPATYGNNERGVIAYIDDDRCVVVWDGKYWRYPIQMRDYKPDDLPDPANYADGHMILNGELYQPLIAWSGDWKGISPVARPYAAGVRPANTDCKEGTMVWNTTSNQVNFNIGGQWLDATGTPDP